MIVAACGSSSSHGTGDGGAPPPSGRWVLGYYVGYSIDSYPIAEIDWTSLTHIAFAPMVVGGDGSIDLSFDDAHGTGVADAQALAQAAHAHDVKALAMLGGAGAGGPIATYASTANRAAFVTRLLAAIDSIGFDGIDLDWEDSVDLDSLVALAHDLRAARPSIVLTYPGGPINGNFQTADPKYADLAVSLDQFNIQTYYPTTAFAGQGWDSWFLAPVSGVTGSTPIAIDDTFARYAALGIPKAKLGMGTAFYAICYTGGITGPRQPTDGGAQIVGGDNAYPLADFYASGGTFATHASAVMRDATAKQPYLSFATPVADAHCGASTQYISYEDEVSIADKGAFATAGGYGGIIIWTINEGYLPANATGGRARTAMMTALRDAFLK